MFNRWELKDFAPGEGSAQQIFADLPFLNGWIEVNVPGDVHSALIATGRIADPYYNTQELDCAWVEQREWWYRTTFIGPDECRSDERLLLVFEGLDTFATLWLNGQELGHSANMFREHVFDVSTAVNPGQVNTLAVCFHPPLKVVEGQAVPSFGTLNLGAEPSKTLMRKAQFGYGWDWGPRLPTIGIWRPVALRRQRIAAIDSLNFTTTAIAPERAQVTVRVDLDRFADRGALNVGVAVRDADQQVVAEQSLALSTGGREPDARIPLTIARPRLWWTHDLGEPYLYTLDVTLTQDGVVLDQRSQPVGIRTIALDQSPDPDEPGTHFFRFVLNGVPIFAKGSDWIPAHTFPTQLTDTFL